MVILDWMMPGMDGVEVCRQVRKRREAPYIYIIFLTAKGQKSEIVEGLEAGADDYLAKPFDSYELHARLRAGRRAIELQEQLLAARDALQEEATHDSVTGLLNRAGTMSVLERELARADRMGSTVAVAMVDVDRFKTINDTYGHLAGDAVLRETARRLSSIVRRYDAIGRYGGDEFLAVISGCDESGAWTFAEKLRALIDHQGIDTPEGMIPVTLSVGVALGSGAKHPDPAELLRAADTALYRAKAAGRNRVELARPEEVLRDREVPLPAKDSPPRAETS
jgi:two-component system cell cycle response regulator